MKKLVLLFILFIASKQMMAQVDYDNPKDYIIGGITVSGTEYLDKDILILLSGLKAGQKVAIPGNDISKCVQNLWKQGLFADVSVNISKMSNDTVFLEYVLQEKPRLASFVFKGGMLRKGQQSDLREKIKLNKGKVLTDNILVNTKNIIKDYFVEKGFTHVNVTLKTAKDTLLPNSVILYIYVDKGRRIKIDNIVFTGNEHIKTKRLKRAMKKTKTDEWWTIFTVSKFREQGYKDDKDLVLALYNKRGFRDAAILSDTVKENARGNLDIHINLSEGPKYYFRNIVWKGNTKYRSGRLDTALNIHKGDIYNGELFEHRLTADPNGNDVSSLYLDDGYLFFSATPVETAVSNDSIDIEIRIYEGPQAIINEVNIFGNDKTHENVIRRSLRTLPGNKFSRADVIRSQREISTLGYFDPEKTQITPIPHPESGTVDINYTVQEKPSDQLELSAGYGGAAYGVTGSLGVKFNNFSMANLFKKDGWQPIPSGDGQQFAIRAQANGKNYQAYTVSFTEPWLGGKKPNSLSIALFISKITTGYPQGDSRYGYLLTEGLSVGYGKQLKWPDDYFTFISSVNYQIYNLNNYIATGFPVSNGTSNEFSLKETVTRNSLDDPTFPHRGSNFTFSIQATPPYSLLSGGNYSNLSQEAKYRWIEFDKYRFDEDWYTPIIGKDLVLRANVKMGFIGFYNPDIGLSPFERFYMGGDGLSGGYTIYGREIISQRGYDAYGGGSVEQYVNGAAAFNKYSLELRYPFSKNPSAFIYGIVFAEAGNEWVALNQYNPFQLNRSMGIGARFILPAFGLLGFNYGIPFDPQPDDPTTTKPTGIGNAFSHGKFTIVLGFEPE